MREAITIRKTTFLKGWSWFKFNNLGLALGTSFKFYTRVAKGLKLKVTKFLGLIPTFVKVTGENLVGGSFCPSPPHILNRVLKNLRFLQEKVKSKHIKNFEYFPKNMTRKQAP